MNAQSTTSSSKLSDGVRNQESLREKWPFATLQLVAEIGREFVFRIAPGFVPVGTAEPINRERGKIDM